MSGDSGHPSGETNGCERASTRRRFLTGSAALGSAIVGLSASDPAEAAEPERVANPKLYSYVGGKTGMWTVISAKTITGEPLPAVERIDIIHANIANVPEGAKWVLRGVTSNERYATRAEKSKISIQVALGRPTATYGAFIPIKKNAKWWALTQDERRAIFEEQSKHISIGFKYLPAIARRLHHCRDLSETEPFDFLTMFDYAKSDASAFDDMMAELRATEEWKYVDREYDIRLVRSDA